MLCGKRCGCGLLHRFGRFFSDRTQIGILPLTRSAPFHIMPAVKTTKVFRLGGIAQLGERLHGMQEVSGSIPLISTKSSPDDLARKTGILLWGYSSAGRALAWHARGQRFDPAYLHQSLLSSFSVSGSACAAASLLFSSVYPFCLSAPDPVLPVT